MPTGGDEHDPGRSLVEPRPERPPWPAGKSRWMTRATLAVMIFGGNFLVRMALVGPDDPRGWLPFLYFGLPALLASLVLLAGVVQQRRAPRR
jgi:hypothetical protein